MARGKTYIVRHRRRREGRTDYRARLSLLKSGKPRLAVRKSSKNIICQIIEYKPKGDKIIVSSDSRNLNNYGWSGHCGNIPAAYLIGLLCGTKANKAGIKEAVMDMGLYASVKGSRLYAVLKGAVDGGLNIPHSDEVLPSKERVEGKHTKAAEKTSKEFAAAKEKILSGKAETEATKKLKEKGSSNQKDKGITSGDELLAKTDKIKPLEDKTKRPI